MGRVVVSNEAKAKKGPRRFCQVQANDEPWELCDISVITTTSDQHNTLDQQKRDKGRVKTFRFHGSERLLGVSMRIKRTIF